MNKSKLTEIRESNGKFHLHTTRFEYKLDKAFFFFLYKCFMKKSNSKLTEKFVYIYLH